MAAIQQDLPRDLVNDRENAPIANSLVEIIDKCNQKSKGAFNTDSYLALLMKMLEERRQHVPLQ